MSIYHLSVKPISRSVGRTATGAAAYRAGEKIIDERTGELFDYSRKRGIVYRELVLPGGNTEDRGEYWNRVENHHKRGDAVLSREVEIALPAELSEGQRQELASKFNRELADKFDVAADLNIHKPHRAKADTRNHHGHIMLSACYTAADGTLGKKAVELDPIYCQRNKLENMTDWCRKRWTELANEALERAGHRERVDCRTLEAQRAEKLTEAKEIEDMKLEPDIVAMLRQEAAELDRPATIHLGPVATAMERRGIQTERGNYNRNALAQTTNLATIRAEQIGIEKRLEEINRDTIILTGAIHAERVRALEDEQKRRSRYRASRSAIRSVNRIAAHILPQPFGLAVQVATIPFAVIAVINDWREARKYRDACAEIRRRLDQVKQAQQLAKAKTTASSGASVSVKATQAVTDPPPSPRVVEPKAPPRYRVFTVADAVTYLERVKEKLPAEAWERSWFPLLSRLRKLPQNTPAPRLQQGKGKEWFDGLWAVARQHEPLQQTTPRRGRKR